MKKEVLIFGANGALGKGVTKSLLNKDYDKYYLFDFNISKNSFENEKAEFIDNDDLSVEENCIKAFDKVKPGKDKLLFLYSTVGGFAGGKNLWEIDEAEWDKMMGMNLKSAFFIAKCFAKLVMQSSGGSICYTSAYAGLEPEAKKAAYGASKGGLIHLVKTLSVEGREINLSVNALAPYIIDTPANRSWMQEADYSSWMQPEEIGDLAHSLFDNFHFISGNVIRLRHRFNINRL